MPTYRYRCGQNHVTDDFRSMARREEPMRCPVAGCGGEAFNTFIPNEGGFNTWTLGTFGVHGGYYDRGLGRYVTSPSHRREVMAELNVVEGCSIADTERHAAEEARQHKAVETAYAADVAEMNRDPSLCRMRDQGRVDFPAPFTPDP